MPVNDNIAYTLYSCLTSLRYIKTANFPLNQRTSKECCGYFQLSTSYSFEGVHFFTTFMPPDKDFSMKHDAQKEPST